MSSISHLYYSSGPKHPLPEIGSSIISTGKDIRITSIILVIHTVFQIFPPSKEYLLTHDPRRKIK
jgi:hypothetical protein